MAINREDKKLGIEKQRLIEFQEASLLFDQVIYKSYLQGISSAKIVPYKGEPKVIRWYRITKIVYEKDIFFTDKMAMLYASLHNVCGMVAMALHKEKNGIVDVYLGTRDEHGADYISGDILEAGLKGILPGIAFESLSGKTMLEGFEKDKTSISCVSGVGSLSDDKKEHFIQGIENLINGTKSIPCFTAFIIADKISKEEASQIQAAYEDLYSEISPLAQIQLSFNESESKGVTDTLTEGFNESISKNVSRTISHGTSQSSSVGTSVTKNSGWNAGGSIIFANAGRTSGKSIGDTTQETVGTNEGTADQQGEGTQEGHHKDKALAKSENITTGRTLQLTKHNRHVKSCMDIIDRQISRIEKSTPSGLWSVATYFVARDNTTSQKLAGIYRGTIVGDKSEIEAVSINLWPRKARAIESILTYLKNQCHPIFKINNDIESTAGSLVDSKELAIHLSLPQSSVPGLLVREEKTFGRDVKSQEVYTEKNSIGIGKVIHLGEIYTEDVRLGINGLSKHTFITGTTGSGKSNTLYLLLSELVKNGKKFLVIEPAKGEYKEMFGNHPEIKDVTVYGTNPRMSKLLTINPFLFPNDADVYEHIDSLVEIFNACWPMYAAMPQVMKHSIMEAYKSCGWDLSRSENTQGIYPTIEDVLDALKEYINSSEYSSDTKGDYKGSLETRLQSLCEGLVGRMFSGTPIPDEDLFNSNSIIDLSRVKSSETKSLLMGLLIMKLNEFRASEHRGMNQELRHVTILEEAHNLLKRTSTDQTAESSNVAGMAVEKIANSMAEMRTYGEGFVIADQSPSLLDLATIRNTNTKIVMALPEKEDREIAGKSIGLNDEQIPEISRLKMGEAIVYQNGWEEPVKVKIHKYEQAESRLWNYDSTEEERQTQEAEMSLLFDILYDLYAFTEPSYRKEDLLEQIINSPLSGRKKAQLLDKVNSVEIPLVDDCASMMATIIGTDLCQQLQNASDIINMNNRLFRELQQWYGLRNSEHIETFANMYVRGCSMEASEPFYEEWQERTAKSKMI
jgi:DNA helicase HerA-like ATPase